MVSFDNTEIAFSGKSDKDLRRSFWLFRMIGSPLFVKIGKGLTTFALKIHFPIKGMIKATIFKQFVGGENIEECSRTVEQLGKYNIGTILDYSVEGKESEADFDNCREETIATIERAKNDPHIPFCVFKVTGLARFDLLQKVSAGEKLSAEEEKEFAKVQQRVDKICGVAHSHSKPIFLDAEESWIQKAIDDLADAMMAKFNKEKAGHVCIAKLDYLNSVPYLRAISLICFRVSCFGGPLGGLHVSRKKPSRPGDMYPLTAARRAGLFLYSVGSPATLQERE